MYNLYIIKSNNNNKIIVILLLEIKCRIVNQLHFLNINHLFRLTLNSLMKYHNNVKTIQRFHYYYYYHLSK